MWSTIRFSGQTSHQAPLSKNPPTEPLPFVRTLPNADLVLFSARQSPPPDVAEKILEGLLTVTFPGKPLDDVEFNSDSSFFIIFKVPGASSEVVPSLQELLQNLALDIPRPIGVHPYVWRHVANHMHDLSGDALQRQADRLVRWAESEHLDKRLFAVNVLKTLWIQHHNLVARESLFRLGADPKTLPKSNLEKSVNGWIRALGGDDPQRKALAVESLKLYARKGIQSAQEELRRHNIDWQHNQA